MAETLLREPGFGLKPVAVFDQTQTWTDSELTSKVAVLHDFAQAAEVARDLKAPYAVIAMPGSEPEALVDTIEEHVSPYFRDPDHPASFSLVEPMDSSQETPATFWALR